MYPAYELNPLKFSWISFISVFILKKVPVKDNKKMVNKCCLKYCKSGASGFAFPRQEKFPDLSKKWTEFVNDHDFKPSVHSRICIGLEHFDGKYVKTGKRNHLIWDNLPIPTIHNNVETKTAKGGFRRRDIAPGNDPRSPPLSVFNGRWASKRI